MGIYTQIKVAVTQHEHPRDNLVILEPDDIIAKDLCYAIKETLGCVPGAPGAPGAPIVVAGVPIRKGYING